MKNFFITLLFIILISCTQQIEINDKQIITNFEECVKAGNPVMESYPRQCRLSDGTNFVEELDKSVTCENLCGDGICQEMVCMSIGCPCAENKENCPEDCS